MRRLRLTLTTTAITAVVAALALLPTVFAQAAANTATFNQESAWPGGYNGRYVVAAASPINGWAVEFDLPASTTVVSAWEVAMTRTGNHYRMANLSYNSSIPAGGSRSFGFTASGNATPTGCLLNGVACGGQPNPTTTGPSPTRTVGPTPTRTAPVTTPRPTPPPQPPHTPPATTPPATTPPAGRVVRVSTSSALQAALTDARAGDSIELADEPTPAGSR